MATANTKIPSTATSPTTPPNITSSTTEQSGIHYNSVYLQTVPGTIKCVCLVSSFVFFIVSHNLPISNNIVFFSSIQIFVLIGFICIQCSQYSPMGIAQFFSTISMISFWFTGILLVLYLFHVVYAYHKIPWMKIEFYFCVAATLFLMLTSSLVAARGVGLFTAAAVRSIYFTLTVCLSGLSLSFGSGMDFFFN